MTEERLRTHVHEVIMNRVARTEDKRSEALLDYFGVMLPGMDDDTAQRLAALVPELLPSLYGKWVGMFVDRLFETSTPEQIGDLCDGSDNNNATLLLVYLMFMESERMELQIEEDLAAYARDHSEDEDMGDLVRDYIKARLAKLNQDKGTLQ